MMAGICNLLYLAIIAVAFSSITAADYCKLQTCTRNSRIHTMCKYTSSTPAKACGQGSRRGLSGNEQNRIVNIHNQLRQKVALGQEKRGKPGPQPAAVRMPKLIWDNELAMVAQKWADQCDFSHDQCRDVVRFQVGQNIAQTSSSGVNKSSLEDMVQLWYNEVKDMDRNKVSKYEFDRNTGHYTQMVWADTVRIGCGKIEYKTLSGWNTKNLVCNYGPSGNWIGQRIYKTKN